MKNYADKLGISGQSWWFLQGNKESTYKLADSYLVSHPKEDGTVAGGFIHDGYFVLIDKQKHIRGAYLGTDPDQVTRLIADIKTLQAEPSQSMVQ
jgi:protein SCO1/2